MLVSSCVSPSLKNLGNLRESCIITFGLTLLEVLVINNGQHGENLNTIAEAVVFPTLVSKVYLQDLTTCALIW